MAKPHSGLGHGAWKAPGWGDVRMFWGWLTAEAASWMGRFGLLTARIFHHEGTKKGLTGASPVAVCDLDLGASVPPRGMFEYCNMPRGAGWPWVCRSCCGMGSACFSWSRLVKRCLAATECIRPGRHRAIARTAFAQWLTIFEVAIAIRSLSFCWGRRGRGGRRGGIPGRERGSRR
jgi:hypothetical protein